MTTSIITATSPINITNNYDNVCSLKCEYKYKYPLSPLFIVNKGQYIHMTIENNNDPQTIYNSEEYQVRDIRLYKKSLHTYAGNHVDAEMIIFHKSQTGNNLLVCIPIVVGYSENSENNESKSIFESIISEMSKTANSVGQKTMLTNSTLTLNKLIPKKPFFSYSGTLPYPPSNGQNDFIVFNKEYALTMTQKTFDIFSKMISESNEQIKNVNEAGLFFNNSGPSVITNKNAQNDNDIYIECLPTGSSGELLVKKDPHVSTLFNASELNSVLNFFNNQIFKQFFGVFVVIGVIYGGKKLIKHLTKL